MFVEMLYSEHFLLVGWITVRIQKYLTGTNQNTLLGVYFDNNMCIEVKEVILNIKMLTESNI